MPLQQRVFWRECERSNLTTAISAVSAEVNLFLASFASYANIRDVQTTISPHTKYGDQTVYMVTVTYLQE